MPTLPTLEVIQVPVPHQSAVPKIFRPAMNPVTVSSGVQKMIWSTVQTSPAASVLSGPRAIPRQPRPF
ncbi:hypothetical protein QBC43DRAFT_354870 [Cladorrhinum sp. PSN259]|nr:hypothetical protein QBC43DRAFT_354870 [Cladorrhinum sp. PSN259]